MTPISDLTQNGPLLIGIDVGTSNIKAAAFTNDGRVVAEASLPTPTHVPAPGQAQYAGEQLWNAVATVLRRVTDALTSPEAIVGVAVASMGEAGVALDATGCVLAETLAWFDPRPAPQAQWLERTVGRERLFAVTGLTPLPIFGLPKILWLLEHRAPQVATMQHWLHIADFIAYKLSGVQATDPSLASRTLVFNLERREWDEALLRDVGLSPSLMAPIVESGSRLGTVTAAAAALTGLPTTASVAAGGQDHVCGALALGVTKSGEVLNSLGTAEVMLAALEGPVRDPQFAVHGYAQGAHVVPGLYYAFGAMFSSGASVDWARALLGATDNEAYRQLLLEAANVPAGSRGVHFLPHLHLANAPFEDALGRGALIGLRTSHDRAALLRSVLEGLAYESRLSLEGLEPYLKTPATRITAIGGSARNALLMQVKASVLGRALEVAYVHEAVCLGAALLAGVGAGVYADALEASSIVRAQRQRIEPDATLAAVYEPRFQQIYKPLYTALRATSHAIAALEPEA